MRLYLSAGELSGDLLGASLATALTEEAPGVRLEGYGGTEMAGAGVKILYDLPALAVMGILPVIRHIPTLRRLHRELEAYLGDTRPDAVVLIDYPGWHFVVAKTARRLGIPVVQFVAPQLWAWAPWRIAKVRKRVDRLLVVLPFEEVYFRDRGVDARFVGHPLVDRMRRVEAELPPPEADASPILGILPGSRRQEWQRLLPPFLRVADAILAEHPELDPRIGCAKEEYRADMQALVRAAGLEIPVEVGATHEIQRDARLVLTSSGTSTLECTYFRTPMVVAYRVNAFSRHGAKLLITAPYIALTNLLAGRELVPEFLFSSERAPKIVQAALSLLESEEKRAAMIEGLDHVRDSLLEKDPSRCAAREILELVASRKVGE